MRHDLPAGTVTLVFTDVQGSTRLLHDVGDDAYGHLLADHHRRCREVWRVHGGVEVDTQGDAFFVAFADATDAVTAAQAAQQVLADAAVSVRIGMHTGDVSIGETGYIGSTVHLAARIAAAGHGGQVLASTTTRAAAGSTFEWTDLGEHRLKDFDRPISLAQLGHRSFPPLRTISVSNLPRPASSFVGREREHAELVDMLRSGARVVTLTGPGGIGKTRLSIDVATSLVADHPAGVFWVGLAAVHDPTLVQPTIAQTLGARESVAEHIGQRRMMLVLDNLEQVIECAPDLSELVTSCPGLCLLMTSREVLRIAGEHEYRVPPLDTEEATELFCERAQLPRSPTIATLCTQLDDMPLALELAAARTAIMTPEQILERLAQRLDLLRGGRDVEPRQQTLRTTIEWSHDLLSASEQQLYRRLAVCAGGCTLEDAETVCGAGLDDLQSLVAKSLVRRTDGRFWMYETIRLHASERLDASGEAEAVGARHARAYAQLAELLAEDVRDHRPHAVGRLAAELDNVRQALAFALDHDDVPLASTALSGLWFFWLITGGGNEALGWTVRYLASPRASVDPLERYGGDDAAAEILRVTGRLREAAAAKRETVAIGRARPDVAINGISMDRLTAGGLSDLAWIHLGLDEVDLAEQHADEAVELRRRIGRPEGIAHALVARAAVTYHRGDFAGAVAILDEAIELQQLAGDLDEAESRVLRCECEVLLGRREGLAHRLGTAHGLVRALGDEAQLVRCARVVGMLAEASDRPELCVRFFAAADHLMRRGGVQLFTPFEDSVHRATVERARSAMTDETVARQLGQGAELSPDDLVIEVDRCLDDLQA